jgi:hypothetical protein
VGVQNEPWGRGVVGVGGGLSPTFPCPLVAVAVVALEVEYSEGLETQSPGNNQRGRQ